MALTRRGLLAVAASALLLTTTAQARMTDVGTPREETPIVDMLDQRVADPGLMNPFLEGVTLTHGLNQLLYSPLWEIDTTTGKQYPVLAATMPEPMDGTFTKFRFKIRDNLAWSDGQKLTAEDVVFTARMLMANAKLPMRGYLKGVIKAISSPDATTVEIETAKPCPRLSVALGSVIFGNNFRTVPKHIWQGVDPATFQHYPPVAAGPLPGPVERSERQLVLVRAP